MDQFITKNISLLNKNNIIKIKFGKKLDDRIFNYKLSKKIIEIFLDNCRKNSIHFTKVSNSTIYKYLNNIVDVTPKKTNYYTYKTLDYSVIQRNSLGFALSVNNIVRNESNVQSIYKYNSISYEEEYTSNINNLFTISINNNIELDNYNKPNDNNYYTISIIIKKPNNYSKIINKIEEIITLIPTTLE